MDFHHKDPSIKDFDIGRSIISKVDWDEIYKELDKCDEEKCKSTSDKLQPEINAIYDEIIAITRKTTELAAKYNLWLVEDDCDSLGATYNGQKTGTFGDLATVSFYPAHHITMGEGGAVLVNNLKLLRPAWSFRDWGRDCYCEPGKDNTCGKRFDWQLGELPCGYDHKYTYSHIGFNLKVTDTQAAIGLNQLRKADRFVAKRRENHKLLYDLIKPLISMISIFIITRGSFSSIISNDRIQNLIEDTIFLPTPRYTTASLSLKLLLLFIKSYPFFQSIHCILKNYSYFT
jgi:hypothetical protein